VGRRYGEPFSARGRPSLCLLKGEKSFSLLKEVKKQFLFKGGTGQLLKEIAC